MNWMGSTEKREINANPIYWGGVEAYSSRKKISERREFEGKYQ